jgi:hypothetical protein
MANKRRISSVRPLLRLKLRGPGIRRGRVSIPDLLKICQEAQNTVNKQAEALQGRKTIHRGPTSARIQQECTLELVGIKPNCTTLEFDLAKEQMAFPITPDFGAEVVDEVAHTIKKLRSRKPSKDGIDSGVLLSLYKLSGLVAPRKISSIEWVTGCSNGHKRTAAPITHAIHERAAKRLSQPQNVIAQIDGVLDMADFKPQEFKCRIDPPVGYSITCTFDQDLENEVYRLLRKPVRIKGQGVIQPYTDRIDAVHIAEIKELPSLALGEGNFAADRSLAELAQIQKVGPLKDPSVLAGGIPDDEDLDEFLNDIYSARR